MAAPTQLTRLTHLSRVLLAGASSRIAQPIALTKADGTVFVTTEGKVLVRGTRRVRPQS